MEEIKFEEGGRYTNRKGEFVVVSISGPNMIIKWDDGETIDTTIAEQSRFVRGLAREKERQAQKKPVKEKKKPSSGGKIDQNFVGLKETDFSKSVTGTVWRSRKCLGGLVTNRLDSGYFNFNSYAVYRMARVFWQDNNHRDSESIFSQAKFLVQVYENNLKCGYYVERTDQSSDSRHDWNGFVDWLEITDNEIWLKTCVFEKAYQIEIEAYNDQSDILISNGERWDDKETGKHYQSLIDYLATIPDDVGVNFLVTKTMPKDYVIDQELDIADEIAGVFNILMPLYKASVMK